MAPDHVFWCNLPREHRERPEGSTLLSSSGRHRNVHVDIKGLDAHFGSALPQAALDLLEIAAFVRAADAHIKRPGGDSLTYEGWSRSFVFHIGVRTPDLWSQPTVRRSLSSTLDFLSGDRFRFAFMRAMTPASAGSYFLKFKTPATPDCDAVTLLSGGLDSCCGAVHEILGNRSNAVLVSHWANQKTRSIQDDLAQAISSAARERGGRVPLHVPIRISAGKQMTRERSWRARSFAFAATATVVAVGFGLKEVRFYENGVVSMNLPISTQVVGSQATRTTHPRVLAGYTELFSAIFGGSLKVTNGFADKTRPETLAVLTKHGCERLIGCTNSCAVTHVRSTKHPHCGLCSQCLDRRLAILSCGQQSHDPVGNYAIDPMTGPRTRDKDRVLAERSYGMWLKHKTPMESAAFLQEWPEAANLLRFLPGTPQDALKQVQGLYHRMASQYIGATTEEVCRHAGEFAQRAIRASSFLRIAAGVGGLGGQPANAAAEDDAPVVDSERQEISFRGKPITVVGKQFQILSILCNQFGKYVPTSVFIENVDGWEGDDDAGITGRLKKQISEIRRETSRAWPQLTIDNKNGRYGLISLHAAHEFTAA